MSLLLALLLAQAPASSSPSTSSATRTAALIGVGVGTPLVTAVAGSLVGLPFTLGCKSGLCGIFIAVGAIAGGAIGLLGMPFALLLTDHLLGTAPEGGAGLVIGGFVGLLLGLGAGAGLLAVGSLLGGSSSAGGLTVSILGGVVALGLPIAGAIIGKDLARASSSPVVALIPLQGGAALSVSGVF